MGLFDVIVLLLCVAIVVTLVQRVPETIVSKQWKQIIFWIAVIAVVLWLVSLFGIFQTVNKVHVGR